MTKLLVIDLDQTIIDSSIRENYCYTGGELDLQMYSEVKTCDNNGISNDCLTPFGQWLNTSYFSLIENDYTLVFLTARLCDYNDYSSFEELGIASMILDHCDLISRDRCLLYGGNPTEQDSGVYKKDIIDTIKQYNDYTSIIVIDDCIKVLEMAKEQGFHAICARELYHYAQEDFTSLFLTKGA